MAVPAPAKESTESEPRPFKIFISYASEDQKVAIAVSNAIQLALGPSAEVFIDNGLRYGVDFQEQIERRLDETDVLVVIYSAAQKPSHSFTGVELGYFLSVMRHRPSQGF